MLWLCHKSNYTIYRFCKHKYNKYIHNTHALSPKGVAEASQIFLRDTHDLPELLCFEEYCRRQTGDFATSERIHRNHRANNPKLMPGHPSSCCKTRLT
jgi:hypothetical protein